jgi:hypothetical protein
MATTTPFTIGAEVSCTDGTCGTVSGVIVDPAARAITHLVVDRITKVSSFLSPWSRPQPAGSGSAAPSRSSRTLTRRPDGSARQRRRTPGPGHARPEPRVRCRAVVCHLGHHSLRGGGGARRRARPCHRRRHRASPGLVMDPGSRQVTHVLLREGQAPGARQRREWITTRDAGCFRWRGGARGTFCNDALIGG